MAAAPFPTNPAVDQLWTNPAGEQFRFSTKGTWRKVYREETMLREGNIIAASLGSDQIVDGMYVTAQSSPNMSVTLGAGVIFAPANLENPSTSAHSVTKQAVLIEPVNVPITGPVTPGYSVTHLIQARLLDVINTPQHAASLNVTLNKFRNGRVTHNLKSGVAAPTGTQVAPSVDTGFIALATITLAQGDTAVTASKIVNLTAARVATKLAQIPAGVQAGRWQTATDTSVVQNVIRAALDPIPAFPIPKGMRLRIITATAAIAGNASFVLNDQLTLPIRRRNNLTLVGGEWAAGDVIDFTYNGSAMELATVTTSDVVNIYNQNFAITTVQTKTVYGTGADFADLPAAYAFLSQKTISSIGQVNLQLPGTKLSITIDIVVNHPNGDRIQIKGAPLKGTLPQPADMNVNGYTTSVQNNDTTLNIALLRNAYATEIAFSQGASMTVTGSLGNFQDVLVTGDGSTVVGGPGFTNGLNLNLGNFALTRMGFVGHNLTGLNVVAANVRTAGGFYSFGNGKTGVAVNVGSVFSVDNGFLVVNSNSVLSADSDAAGMNVLNGSILAIVPFNPATIYPAHFNGNKNHGLYIQANSSSYAGRGLVANRNALNGVAVITNSSLNAPNATLTNNGSYGAFAASMSYVSLNTATVNGSPYAFGAANGAQIDRTGSTASGTTAVSSPALNTVGNNQAYIF